MTWKWYRGDVCSRIIYRLNYETHATSSIIEASEDHISITSAVIAVVTLIYIFPQSAAIFLYVKFCFPCLGASRGPGDSMINMNNGRRGNRVIKLSDSIDGWSTSRQPLYYCIALPGLVCTVYPLQKMKWWVGEFKYKNPWITLPLFYYKAYHFTKRFL
jgi:hypothetical protein